MIHPESEDEVLKQYDAVMWLATLGGATVIVAAYFTLLYVAGRAMAGGQ